MLAVPAFCAASVLGKREFHAPVSDAPQAHAAVRDRGTRAAVFGGCRRLRHVADVPQHERIDGADGEGRRQRRHRGDPELFQARAGGHRRSCRRREERIVADGRSASSGAATRRPLARARAIAVDRLCGRENRRLCRRQPPQRRRDHRVCRGRGRRRRDPPTDGGGRGRHGIAAEISRARTLPGRDPSMVQGRHRRTGIGLDALLQDVFGRLRHHLHDPVPAAGRPSPARRLSRRLESSERRRVSVRHSHRRSRRRLSDRSSGTQSRFARRRTRGGRRRCRRQRGAATRQRLVRFPAAHRRPQGQSRRSRSLAISTSSSPSLWTRTMSPPAFIAKG